MENLHSGRICDETSEQIIATAEKLATTYGTENISVRKILQTLGVTNRVFYNRFQNLDEVLHIVYERTILKIRESMYAAFDPEKDFFTQAVEIVANTLVMSYENKMHFNLYVFENDSVSQSNFRWWTEEIKKLIEFAKSRHLIKDVDSDIVSYAIWCFCRGYNADAVGRQIPLHEAVQNFKYSFSILLDGLKA